MNQYRNICKNINLWKNVSNTCFFRKSHSTASWVILVIQQQHFEEKFVLNPIFSESLIPEQPFDFFFFSDSIFFLVSTLEQHLIGPKKVNSRAAQNCSKSGPMVIFSGIWDGFLSHHSRISFVFVILQQHLIKKCSLVSSAIFLNSRAAQNKRLF